MPSEQSPPSNTNSARTESPEQGQRSPISGNVRGLLGLPSHDSRAFSTVALTTPSAVRHRQSLFSVFEEDDAGFDELSSDEEVGEEVRRANVDFPERLTRGSDVWEYAPQKNSFHSRRRASALLARGMQENLAEAGSTPAEFPAAQREQTRLVIPGVSTHRTDFPALSQASDTPTSSEEGELRDVISQQATPLNAPISLPHAREMTTSDITLLTRLEQLVTESTQIRKGAEARPMSLAPSPSSPVARGEAPNTERGGKDLAQRLEHLQHTVSDLAATVSAQAAHMRDQSQAQERERKTLSQRLVVVQRGDASSTTPRAFWERSRLGRFSLKTRR